MDIVNSSWFGRLKIFKPKKGEKIGVPYEPWHHFALIDDRVLIYVWDTREIIDSFNVKYIAFGTFDTAKINDNCQPLFVGRNTSERAKASIESLLQKFPDLPIISKIETGELSIIKQNAENALKEIGDIDEFEIMDDAKTVFIDKSVEIPESMLYMFTEMETFNPVKRKFTDMNPYVGRARYYAIIARCAILSEWRQFINR